MWTTRCVSHALAVWLRAGTRPWTASQTRPRGKVLKALVQSKATTARDASSSVSAVTHLCTSSHPALRPT
eukprot:8995039-Karenia_brevis.AAC.1